MFWPGPEDSHEAEEALQSVSARREATIRRHSARPDKLQWAINIQPLAHAKLDEVVVTCNAASSSANQMRDEAIEFSTPHTPTIALCRCRTKDSLCLSPGVAEDQKGKTLLSKTYVFSVKPLSLRMASHRLSPPPEAGKTCQVVEAVTADVQRVIFPYRRNRNVRVQHACRLTPPPLHSGHRAVAISSRHTSNVSELIAANMRNLPESTGNRNLGYPDDAAIRHVFSMVSRDKHAIVTDVAILQRFCCEAPMTQRVLT
ncbi:hypothetical protein BaRGS_00006422, partial [Batillaria attramentaria]